MQLLALNFEFGILALNLVYLEDLCCVFFILSSFVVLIWPWQVELDIDGVSL